MGFGWDVPPYANSYRSSICGGGGRFKGGASITFHMYVDFYMFLVLVFDVLDR